MKYKAVMQVHNNKDWVVKNNLYKENETHEGYSLEKLINLEEFPNLSKADEKSAAIVIFVQWLNILYKNVSEIHCRTDSILYLTSECEAYMLASLAIHSLGDDLNLLERADYSKKIKMITNYIKENFTSCSPSFDSIFDARECSH